MYAIDKNDLGDEELIGMEIRTMVPVDGVEAEGQGGEEDDNERENRETKHPT
jgi:hypothetical protein